MAIRPETGPSAADHTQGVAGGRPVLAREMYEQSYHIDCGSGATAHVDAYTHRIPKALATLFELTTIGIVPPSPWQLRGPAKRLRFTILVR